MLFLVIYPTNLQAEVETAKSIVPAIAKAIEIATATETAIAIATVKATATVTSTGTAIATEITIIS